MNQDTSESQGSCWISVNDWVWVSPGPLGCSTTLSQARSLSLGGVRHQSKWVVVSELQPRKKCRRHPTSPHMTFLSGHILPVFQNCDQYSPVLGCLSWWMAVSSAALKSSITLLGLLFINYSLIISCLCFSRVVVCVFRKSFFTQFHDNWN